MRRNYKKRWLALLLSAAMAATSAPVSAGEFTDGVIEGTEEVTSAEREMVPGAELFDAGGELTEEETPDIVFGDGGDETEAAESENVAVESGDYTYEIIDGNAYITRYTGTASNVTVPEIIDEHIVDGFSPYAFRNNSYIKNVVLPDSILRIGSEAFSGCTSLESLKLPSKLQTLGYHFIEQTAIECIIIPNTLINVICDNTGGWKSGPLHGAKNLKKVILEEGIKTIPAALCCVSENQVNSITEIVIPDTVTKIDSYAFWGCRALKKIRLPKELLDIGSGAFLYCFGLEEITIPSKVLNMGEGAFNYCWNLQHLYFEGPVPKSIGNVLFSGCDNNKINLYYSEGEPSWNEIVHDSHWVPYGEIIWKTWNPSSSPDPGEPDEPDEPEIPSDAPDFKYVILSGEARVTEYIGNAAEIKVSEQLGGKPVTEIRMGAFNKETDNVKSISLPSTVKILDPEFCIECGGLEKITVAPENPYLCSENNVIYNKEKTKVITVLRNEESVILPDGVTEIGERAFKGCKGITEAVIPDGAIRIDFEAFRDCVNLESINIPDTVTTINKNAFENCPKLVIYGTTGSYAEKFAKEQGIPFNAIQAGKEYLLVGELEGVNAETGEINIEGTKYSASENFSLSDAMKIIIERGAGTQVICNIRDRKVIHMDVAEDVVTPVLRIKTLSSGTFTYSGGKYDKEQVTISVSAGCEVKENPYYTAADLRNSISFSAKELYLTFEGIGMKWGTAQGGTIADDRTVWKKFSNESLKLVPGEFNNIVTIPLLTETRYVPDSVSTYNEINGTLSLKKGEKDIPDIHNTRVIAVQNKDLQNQKAEEKKQETAAANRLNTAREKAKRLPSSILALDSNFMNSYFTQSERKNVEQFLLVWLTELVESQSITYCVKDKKLRDKVLGKLGVNKNSIPRTSGKIQGSIFVESNTAKYGRVRIKFTATMSSYGLGDTASYASFGTLSCSVEHSDKPIPSTVPQKQEMSGGFTYNNLKNFGDSLKAVAEDAVKKAYNESWGKYADKVAELIVDDTIRKILEDKFGKVSECVYKLMQEPAKAAGKRITAKCPVDVYVYNSRGELCGVIKDNKPDPAYNEVFMEVNGDAKSVFFIGDEYFVKLIGNDTGTMTYKIEEYEGDSPVRTVTFEEVPLKKGKTYDSYIPENVKLDNCLYNLEGDAGESLKPDADTWQEKLPQHVFVEGIAIDRTVVSGKVGEKVNLKASVNPSNADDKEIHWNSDNETIVTVDEKGMVTFKAPGTAVITAETNDGGFRASCTCTVASGGASECAHKWSGWKIITEATVLAAGKELRRCLNCGVEERRELPKLKATISVSKKTLTLKEKQSVTVTVSCGKGDSVASWTSSSESVTTVDSKGKITGKKAGRAVVTVKLKSGLSAKISVEVQKTAAGKPSKPVISGISNVSSGVKLSWKKASGALKYYVYRSVNGSSYKKVKILTGTSWTDTKAKTNGAKYRYKIYANNKSGNSGAAVTKICCFLPRMAAPKLSKNSSYLLISWKQNTRCSGYQLQYATNKNFTGATTAKTDNKNYNRAGLSGLPTGRTYYVRIRSFKNASGVISYSSWSAVSKIKY